MVEGLGGGRGDGREEGDLRKIVIDGRGEHVRVMPSLTFKFAKKSATLLQPQAA